MLLIIFAAAQGLNRSLVGDPMLVNPTDARQRPGAPVSATLLIGSGLGVLMALVGIVLMLFGVALGPELIVVAVALPGLLLHDLGRYLGFATQRPILSIALDVLWLLLLVAALSVVALEQATLGWFVAAWAGSGAAASLLVLRQHPGPLSEGMSWLRQRWAYSWRFLTTFAVTQGSALTFSVVVAGVAGAAALGAVSGALLLTRPYLIFQTAAVAAGVSEIANEDGAGGRRNHLRRTAGLATGLALLNGAALLLLPDWVGRLLLDETWESTQVLLAATALQILCLGLLTGPRAYLTGAREIRLVAGAGIAHALIVLAGGCVGLAISRTALGAYWGIAWGQMGGAVLWWVALAVAGRSARLRA